MFNSKSITCEIFHSNISDRELQVIQQALKATYENILAINIGGELSLIEEAYHPKRAQYDADILIKHLLNSKTKETALWVIDKDLFCKGMNFIFGFAIYHSGALLSLFRLSSSVLVEKEAIHEVGHVLGLSHCSNNCVMQFSNSLWEAKSKPSYLCDECKRKI